MMQSAPTDLVVHRSPILLTVDGKNLFRGLVDDYTPSTDKKKGYAKEIKARGYASRWLDTYSSIHRASDSALDLANRILAEYEARRGFADPSIPWKTNGAPSNLAYPIFQRRESIQDMFMGLAQLLAAPPGYLSGSDYMYDFYVDADGKANFVKVAGTWAKDSSNNNLQLKDNHRTVSKVEVRGTPVKNDIWLWGGQTSGRLPLDMQANFQNWVQPYDAWTENTASLFGGYPNGMTVISVSGAGEVGIGQNPAFGNYAIKATITGVGASNLCYVYLRFPIPGRTLGQEPGGGFNTFNEAPQYLERKWDGSTWTNPTGMSEQMGEIQGIGFYLFSTQNFTWFLEVVDGSNRKLRNEPTKYEVGGFMGFGSGYWYFNENQAFGPSTQWKVFGSPGYSVEDFDWSNVAELIWHFNDYPTANHVVWIDGLRFIKPLVVHYPDYNTSGTSNPYNDPWNNAPYPYAYRSATALSTEIRTEQSIDDWRVGKRIAASLYETMAYPQAYWTLEGFGVTECIPGQRFLYDTNELCLRENRFKISKDEGFSSILTAVAQYRSGRWSNECLADYGRIMKEVYRPITNVTKSVSGS